MLVERPEALTQVSFRFMVIFITRTPGYVPRAIP
jgi:hypothetical protein